MDINNIQKLILESRYQISVHAEKERYEDDISLSDLETVILAGEILEDYPNDPRGESCLVLGYDHWKRAIHVVCGHASENELRIITVYRPKLPKWMDERTRRR